MKAIVMIGISGSGKSRTTAQFLQKTEEEYVILSRDNIRKSLLQNYNPNINLWEQYNFDKNFENKVTSVFNNQLETAASNNKNIIIDNTNLHKHHNEKLEDRLIKLNYQIEFFNQNTTWNINAYRYDNNNRIDKVKDSAINDQYITAAVNGYINAPPANMYESNIALVDIDGTVADHNNERHPFDYSKVINDKPREHVIKVLNALCTAGDIYFIQFLSGRESSCYEDTIKWLSNVAGFDMNRHRLLMRKTNDHRKDVIIKSEIYENCLKGNFNINYVFDDRNQVVDYWWDQNLPVFHVGDYRNVF